VPLLRQGKKEGPPRSPESNINRGTFGGEGYTTYFPLRLNYILLKFNNNERY